MYKNLVLNFTSEDNLSIALGFQVKKAPKFTICKSIYIYFFYTKKIHLSYSKVKKRLKTVKFKLVLNQHK